MGCQSTPVQVGEGYLQTKCSTITLIWAEVVSALFCDCLGRQEKMARPPCSRTRACNVKFEGQSDVKKGYTTRKVRIRRPRINSSSLLAAEVDILVVLEVKHLIDGYL